MSAWGTALFSDDTAADVRDSYRDFIGDGLTGPQATDALIKEWSEVLNDPEESAVFWLAMASAQWQCGRLEPRVKAQALKIIEAGTDLHRWREDQKLLKKREAVLAKLQSQLISPQPPEKRIPKRYRNTCDWEVGEVLVYRLLSGKPFLFRVIGFHSDKGGTSPVCEMLSWAGAEIPPEKILARLKTKGPQFMLGRLKENELPADRITRLFLKTGSNSKPDGYTVLLWSRLDQQLREIFGVE
jgi:hypothetical protein